MKDPRKAPPSRALNDPTAGPDKSLPKKLKILTLVGVSLVLLTAGLLYAYRLNKPKTIILRQAPSSPPNHQFVTVSFENIPDEIKTHLLEILQPKLGDKKTQTIASGGQIQFSQQPSKEAFSWTIYNPSKAKPIISGTILEADKTTYYLSLTDNSANYAAPIKTALTQAYPDQNWTYLALGDIIPARDVYTYSKRLGFTYPVLKIADRTKQADLTVANLETTVADGQANGEGAGMMVFTAPAQALDALTMSGIDGVNLANNHAMNGGSAKVADMLTNLNQKKIGSFGVGKSGIPSIWSTTVKGLRISHLGYDTVPGNIEPTSTTPGARRIALSPWGSLSATDINLVKADIQTAKQSADIVIPWFHWGSEYTHLANDQQRRLAQACVDAGADVVIGTHPHWTQGVELYKDHLIAYSLGNFVFDQNWSEETKRSAELELQFNGKQVVSAKLLPAKIENWVQPRFLEASEPIYSQILDDIAKNSWWQ